MLVLCNFIGDDFFLLCPIRTNFQMKTKTMCDHPGSAESSLALYTTIKSGFMTKATQSKAVLLYSSSEKSYVFLLFFALQPGYVTCSSNNSYLNGVHWSHYGAVYKIEPEYISQQQGFTDHLISESRWSLTTCQRHQSRSRQNLLRI